MPALVLVAVAAYLLWPTPGRDQPGRSPTLLWVFEAPRRGGLVAAPCVTPDAVYVSAVHARGFRLGGAVYAIDPDSGKLRWAFDADGDMLPSASAPVVAGGRLLVGEGMHAHFACHLYALDAATGKRQWAVATTDHVESTATVVDGVAYFGAGNDGLYAVDADTGKPRWQFNDGLHIDASPGVSNGRVIVGSGPSRRFRALAVVAIDAKLGREVWRRPVDLPAWGSPRVADGRVFVGLGNGRLTESADKPAGALLCLSEEDGRVLWRVSTADAVFQQPTVADGRVYFGSRDGHLYAVRADTGDVVFKIPMGGPVVSPPAVEGGKVYVVTVGGVLRCLAAGDGAELWRYALHPSAEVLVFGAVRVAGGRVYVAAEVKAGDASTACLYCLKP